MIRVEKSIFVLVLYCYEEERGKESSREDFYLGMKRCEGKKGGELRQREGGR